MTEQNKVWRILDGEALVLDLQGGAYYSLNPVGTAILKAAVEGKTTDGIVETVSQAFPDAPPQIRQELESFLTDLKNADLLNLSQPGQEEDDEELAPLLYSPPKMHRYDQFSQVVSYSPDEL